MCDLNHGSLPSFIMTLQKASVYCVLSNARASQHPRSHVDTEAAVQSSSLGTVDCPGEGQHNKIYLDCFIAVVFFISEIVLFNILNKILRNKWYR